MAFPLYTPDVRNDADTADVLFTTVGEMQRLCSYLFELLHVDDADPTDDNYISGTDADVTTANILSEVIQRATSKIMMYLAPRFSAEQLSTLPRIREMATYWACHDLSRRRGNQPIYEAEVAELEDELERIRLGELFLDVPVLGQRAVVQSYNVDSRFIRSPIRVQRYASSRVTETINQKLAYEYPFFWL